MVVAGRMAVVNHAAACTLNDPGERAQNTIEKEGQSRRRESREGGKTEVGKPRRWEHGEGGKPKKVKTPQSWENRKIKMV
jgi:hypothetical protein